MSTGPGLPENLQAQLASALEEGAKPVALSPLEARYAGAPASGFGRLHIRGGRLAFAAVALAMLVALAMVGNPAPRTWVVRSVDSAVHKITEPEPTPSHSPSPEHKGTAGETPHATIVPTVGNHESPDTPKHSPEPSHEPFESPRPPEPHEPPQPPSPGPGGDGNGHDHSPSPGPSPTPSGEADH